MYSYYDMHTCYYRHDGYERGETNEEIITFDEAVNLIRKSVEDEKEDEMFYDELIKEASNPKEKEIIISIRDDERKHNQILRRLYEKFTGEILHDMPMPEMKTMEDVTYQDKLEKALFGELDAVKKYRKIMGAMPDEESRTLLMSIMTDEIRHANKYNFLIANQK